MGWRRLRMNKSRRVPTRVVRGTSHSGHGFCHVRRYPPDQYPGIIVLRLPDTAVAPEIVAAFVERFLMVPEFLEALAGRLAIVEVDRVRFRPPIELRGTFNDYPRYRHCWNSARERDAPEPIPCVRSQDAGDTLAAVFAKSGSRRFLIFNHLAGPPSLEIGTVKPEKALNATFSLRCRSSGLTGWTCLLLYWMATPTNAMYRCQLPLRNS